MPRRQGAVAPRGQGAVAPRGQGALAPRGQGALAPRGQGALAPRGQGAVAPRGQGPIAPRGQGAVVPTHQGALAPSDAGSVAARHLGAKWPQLGAPDDAGRWGGLRRVCRCEKARANRIIRDLCRQESALPQRVRDEALEAALPDAPVLWVQNVHPTKALVRHEERRTQPLAPAATGTGSRLDVAYRSRCSAGPGRWGSDSSSF